MPSEAVFINEDLSIPISELRFETSRSSGPGGQHVNKTESRVTLVFDLEAARSLTDDQRSLLGEALGSRISKEGELRISSQSHRSQRANREETLERFSALLVRALTPLRERKTTSVPRQAKRKRLDEKRRQSDKKRQRRTHDWE